MHIDGIIGSDIAGRLDDEIVRTKLKDQIAAWATADNCPNGAGEKCLYQVSVFYI